MSLENESTQAGASEDNIVAIPPTQDDGPLTLREAARSVTDWRHKQAAGEEQPAESAPEATAEESAVEADAAPPEEAPGETQEVEPAEDLPPIDPPRSWTKDEKDRFKSLPRETQEYIASREQERERTVRQSQNEAAEQRKAIEAERSKVEQARQQYESALPILLQTLSANYNADFADIKTIQDVQRLSVEDPLRYTQWDAHQKQIAAVQQEIAAAQQRQAHERNQQLIDFRKREAELFIERAPEFADEAQRAKLQSSAVSVLKDLGFKDNELADYWNGERDISIHDHRFHLLVRDAIKLREMQEKAKQVKAVPKPPVQRPGVPQGKNAAREAEIQALNKQLETAKGVTALRIAAKLTQMERAARR
jgi:hypothetical protein